MTADPYACLVGLAARGLASAYADLHSRRDETGPVSQGSGWCR